MELDKPRRLRFDFNAAAAFEEATGKTMFDISVWASPTAKDLRALLWSLLLHEDKDLTLEQVGSFMYMGNLAAVTANLARVYEANTPEADGKARPLAESPPQ